MKILSWNVAGRVRGVPEQAAALATEPADVVALQEVRASALAAWEAALVRLGYEHRRSSFEEVDIPHPAPPLRRLGVLIGARSPLEPAGRPELPWPERYLAVAVEDLELHVLHAPISQKAELVKVRTLESVFARLAAPSTQPQLLVGDLNTPRYESREGEITTFARTESGRLRPELGERHDAAELALIATLRDHGWVDAFRLLHGYSRRDRSWTYPGRPFGYRLDHAIARNAHVEACEYVHVWRERRLSDHSALWTALSAAPPRPGR